jgi:hypothetical protein
MASIPHESLIDGEKASATLQLVSQRSFQDCHTRCKARFPISGAIGRHRVRVRYTPSDRTTDRIFCVIKVVRGRRAVHGQGCRQATDFFSSPSHLPASLFIHVCQRLTGPISS